MKEKTLLIKVFANITSKQAISPIYISKYCAGVRRDLVIHISFRSDAEALMVLEMVANHPFGLDLHSIYSVYFKKRIRIKYRAAKS